MREHSRVIRFILYSLGLCISWFILYDFLLGSLDEWLTFKVVDSSIILLKLIGYNAEAHNTMVQINGQDVVFVNHACNGMVLIALFTGFILVFPGPLYKKLIYIPVGILLINFLNIVRVVGLSLNAYHHYHTLNFNHKYTFTFLVYAAIFALWMLWVKKYSGLPKHGRANAFKTEAKDI